MKKTSWIPTALLLSAFLLPGRVNAQELGEVLEEVGTSYAELYVRPLADALGADMNTGLFHSARVGGGLLPLVDVYAGVKVMGAFVPDDDKVLNLSYETTQTYEVDGETYDVPVTFSITNGPTVFGETERGTATAAVNETFPGPDGMEGTEDDVVIDTTATFDVLPGLIDTPIAPFFVPQLGVGSLLGTDVTIRYLPKLEYKDVGSIGFVGIGVRHSLSQYIPLFPVSVSAQVMWQKLGIEDADDNEVFAASAFAGNLAASKTFLVLTVYGGLQVERSSIDVEYTFRPEDSSLPSERVSFDLTGDNTYRIVAGAALNLGPMLINLDAGVGNRTVVSGGLGLSL